MADDAETPPDVGGEEMELTPAQKEAVRQAGKEREMREKTRGAFAEEVDNIMEGVAEVYRGLAYVVTEGKRCANRTVYPVKEFLVGDSTTPVSGSRNPILAFFTRDPGEAGIIDEVCFEMS
mmetsp:Transcript_5588/g.13992  ORF Transcript_5588/g.13992 Transcript_5588/m.13992 type:complete len:121 (+) Transcript_5588:44-406(+)|eukprot:CAMPEP_0179003350 /NCGR_PEP_ID=MMETSP0795-20121207/12616_1 /TAXON_ID=88552 /ORGANISM="Amoebophrya sp., Strain Ameob2" /LENGTH=120 /DNA_ID=CAMNT_0020697323 /DNA_START=40 /DNA_END=402 /DNA_ORIENTATION=-